MDDSRTRQGPTPGLQGRLQMRFDALTRRLAGATPVETAAEAEAETDLAGQTAPSFALVDLEGARVTLESLLAPRIPLLLVFVDPHCSTCHEFLPDLGSWQRVYHDRLAIALISTGEPATNRAMTAEYGIQPVLLQRELEVVEGYGLLMAPAAVLVRPDGRIDVGPRYGPHRIRQLVADALGLILPSAPALKFQPVSRGEPAPRLHRPDLEGNVVDLSSFLGEPILLLFWSPGCGYCQELLAHILAFEQASTRLRLVVISGGSVAVNRELGFASPVVLDDDRTIAHSYGVSGTPAAVLIGAKGTVASEVARGAVAVLAHIDRCHVPEMTPFPDQSSP